jgi:uncharacterized repeat protein (TIGR03803 family)
VLYSFCSRTNCGDGGFPFAGLIFDQAGNLYGTTFAGGATGGGTAFKLTPHSDARIAVILWPLFSRNGVNLVRAKENLADHVGALENLVGLLEAKPVTGVAKIHGRPE